MTTEDARTKWCPMVRVTALREGCATGATTNQIDESYTSCQCISKDCMMWRWTDPTYTWTPTSEGYCGLGGVPL
jgi:hypothetical protein